MEFSKKIFGSVMLMSLLFGGTALARGGQGFSKSILLPPSLAGEPDNSAPKTVGTFPEAQQKNVSVTPEIKISFDENIKLLELGLSSNPSGIYEYCHISGGNESLNCEINPIEGNTLTLKFSNWDPTFKLKANTTYTVTINLILISDLLGNGIGDYVFEWSFTTWNAPGGLNY